MILSGDLLKRSVILLAFVFFYGAVETIFYRGEHGIAHSKTVPAVHSDDHLPPHLGRIVPQGWKLMGAVKRFSPENLWKQINGRAGFFLSYGMVRMTFSVYTLPSDPETFIDVSIYNMGNPTHAFGAFSAERQKDLKPVDLGREGYRSGASLFIWKGAYYVRMIASEEDAALQKINLKLAEKITDLLDDSGESVWGLETLPKADRVPGSEQYFRKDAMGLDFMQNTFLAQYRKKGARIALFLLKEKNPASAENILNQYAAYAKQFGEGLREITRDGVKVILCDMGGSYDALFQKDDIIAGVTSVEDRDLAVDSAFEFRRHL